MTTLVREQFRMVDGLADLPSWLFYGGRLTDSHTTVLSLREGVQRFSTFISRTYALQGPRLLLDVANGRCVVRLINLLERQP